MTVGLPPHYLCVDEFMRDVVGARALQSAFELGLIDVLLRSEAVDRRSLASRLRLESRALDLLLGMLQANGVIEQPSGSVVLSGRFLAALEFRDLLQAKLEFAALVTADFLEMCTPLLAEPERFFEQARIFDLFSYGRCFEATPETVAMTRRWMRFTSALTRYEAQACIEQHDFSRCRRLLDVGGNSGEFVLRICRVHAGVHATVLDLPVVCQIGRAHVGVEMEAARIDFIETSGADADFPSGFDTVCFKSMLHDWPDHEMRGFLERAYHALEVGGRLLIFERGVLEIGASQVPYSLIPIMLFFRSYRSPEDYVMHLEQIGFREINLKTIELEMPFMLITAVK
ncbi:MAG: methyltransferase [Sulfuritalea sp.]|nr:methyltransferase [Sulfuritalea sp.]